MHVHMLNIESMNPIKKILGESWGDRPPSPPPPQLAPLNDEEEVVLTCCSVTNLAMPCSFSSPSTFSCPWRTVSSRSAFDSSIAALILWTVHTRHHIRHIGVSLSAFARCRHICVTSNCLVWLIFFLIFSDEAASGSEGFQRRRTAFPTLDSVTAHSLLKTHKHKNTEIETQKSFSAMITMVVIVVIYKQFTDKIFSNTWQFFWRHYTLQKKNYIQIKRMPYPDSPSTNVAERSHVSKTKT